MIRNASAIRNVRLDALRGIAVLLVMLHHAAPETVPGSGVVGVMLFFALSGHLITGLLLAEIDATGRIRFAEFYRRRAVRLLPALLLAAAGIAAVTLTLDPLHDRNVLGRTLAVTLTYTTDLPFAHGSAAIFHLWTLAVEQQFYLLWPPALLWAWRRGRATALVIGSIVLLAVAGAAITLHLGAAFDHAYTWPTSWSTGLLCGAAARLYAHHGKPGGPLARRIAGCRAAAPWALLLLLAAGLVPWRSSALTYPAGALALAALSTLLVAGWAATTAPTGRALDNLARLGAISYAAYLWNYPLTLWLRAWNPTTGPLLAALFTLLVAVASRHLVEQPATRRWNKPSAPRIRAAGAVPLTRGGRHRLRHRLPMGSTGSPSDDAGGGEPDADADRSCERMVGMGRTGGVVCEVGRHVARAQVSGGGGSEHSLAAQCERQTGDDDTRVHRAHETG
ncbi:acyltransferase family protein [Streptomyces sp. NPDC051546]|uniref:acyltransferase family protein n=1 Tax=Streptomyces sp. NPDC051546 TaxID=3365655 RepID=UPI00379F1443